MQYLIHISQRAPDLATITNLLSANDAAAVADFDAASNAIRVSTSLHSDDLASLLDQAGCRVLPGQIQQLPSTCCGGCGG